MGGIAYAAPGMNDNKRIAKATEDTKSAIEVNTRKLDEVKGELAKLGWAR